MPHELLEHQWTEIGEAIARRPIGQDARAIVPRLALQHKRPRHAGLPQDLEVHAVAGARLQHRRFVVIGEGWHEDFALAHQTYSLSPLASSRRMQTCN